VCSCTKRGVSYSAGREQYIGEIKCYEGDNLAGVSFDNRVD